MEGVRGGEKRRWRDGIFGFSDGAAVMRVGGRREGARERAEARALNRLPFLGPIFAVGWPLDDPGGPRNQLKKSQKAGGSA